MHQDESVAMLGNNRTINVLIIVMGMATFGSSTMFTVFILYAKHVLMLSSATATHVFAIWLSVYFILHVFAGYLGQRHVGYFVAIIAGLLLSCIGENVIVISTLPAFYIGLVIFSVGVSLYSVNLWAAFGTLFTVSDARRSRAFIILYVVMNVGAFLGDSISGHLINFLGYQWVFILASVSYLIGIVTLVTFGKYTQPDKPSDKYRYLILSLFSVVSGTIGYYLILCDTSLEILCIGLFVFCIIFLWIKNRHQVREVKRKAITFLVFAIFLLFYWGFYMLYPSVVELYMDTHKVITFLGEVVQPSTVASLSPFFLVLIGFLIARFKKEHDTTRSISYKMVIGLIALTLGFLVLMLSTKLLQWPFVFFGFMILSYFFYALSEILIGPVGYSMVGILISTKLVGMMMGFLTLQRSISALLTGYLAHLASRFHIEAYTFGLYAGLTFFISIVLFSLTGIMGRKGEHYEG